jgi:hypothetical protein
VSPRTTPSLPIACEKYEPLDGARRCRHYHANGACGLPDAFMCSEWLKANSHLAPPAAPTPPPLERDLFGAPMVHASPAVGSPASLPTRTTPPPTVAAADLASFQALGVEVRIASNELGELWLVPAYTGADRQELSFEHAALLATLCSALPRARITALVRKAKRMST